MGLGIATGAYFLARYGIRYFAHTDAALLPFIVGGLLVVALALMQLKGGVGRVRALDPAVLAATQIAIALVAMWLYYAISGIGTDPAAYEYDTWRTPFLVELPLLGLAFAAVGLGVSRGWGSGFDRLGIVWPSWWQPCLALLIAILLLFLAGPVNELTYLLMPKTYYAIVAVDIKTSAESGLSVALIYAVMAGLAEETLFRGALQPRAGIVITALLFAMIHVQYGVSPILALIFVHGLVYGLVRRYINTTTAIMAHAGYDALLSIGLTIEIVAILALVMAVVLVGPAVRRWPAYAVAGFLNVLFVLVGVAIHGQGANLAAFVCVGVGSSLLMSLTIGFEAYQRGTLVLGSFGAVLWLVAAGSYASGLWLDRIPFAVALAGTASAIVGMFIWYRLLITQPDPSDLQTIGLETN